MNRRGFLKGLLGSAVGAVLPLDVLARAVEKKKEWKCCLLAGFDQENQFNIEFVNGSKKPMQVIISGVSFSVINEGQPDSIFIGPGSKNITIAGSTDHKGQSQAFADLGGGFVPIGPLT